MTRIQIGDVCQESNGDEYHVHLDRYGNEEPDTIIVDGKACNLVFDPGTPAGRAQVHALIARLTQALTEHDKTVEEIYGTLQPGDHCPQIREPHGAETRCGRWMLMHRCSRVEHADRHHVCVDEDYEVIAVKHPTVAVVAGELPRVSLIASESIKWVGDDV